MRVWKTKTVDAVCVAEYATRCEKSGGKIQQITPCEYTIINGAFARVDKYTIVYTMEELEE